MNNSKSLCIQNKRPIWIGLIILVALLFSFINTMLVVQNADFPVIGGDVKNIIQMVQKSDDSSLFSRDFMYSDDSYKLYMPEYIHLIQNIHRFFPELSYEQSIQVLMFPICFFFILTMTWLIFRLTEKYYLSLFIALISTLSFEIIYGSLTYSVGLYVTPRFLHLAIAPLLFGSLLFYGRHKIWGPVAFFITGVSANLHFGSGAGLVFAFGLGWFIYDMMEKPSIAKFKHWFFCGILSIIGMLPFVISFLSSQTMAAGNVGSDIGISPDLFNSMLQSRFAFFPMDIYSNVLQISPAIVGLIKLLLYIYPVLFVACLLLRYSNHSRQGYYFLFFTNILMFYVLTLNETRLTVLLMILPVICLGVYDYLNSRETDAIRILLQYVIAGSILIGAFFSLITVDIVQSMHLFMPTFYYDFGVTLKYLPFVFMIYIAILISELTSKIESFSFPSKKKNETNQRLLFHYMLIILVCAIIFTLIVRAWIAPYNGLPHYLAGSRSIISGESTIQLTKYQQDYLNSMDWIKNNTQKNSLFLVLVKNPPHDFMFRYKAQRSMWACEKDGGMSFYKGRNNLVTWYQEFSSREQFVREQDSEGLLKYANSKNIDYLFIDKDNFHWFSTAPDTVVFENSKYKIVRLTG